ncbi:FG-GAP-like repeat-containing protein [Tessaracoccus sp.]
MTGHSHTVNLVDRLRHRALVFLAALMMSPGLVVVPTAQADVSIGHDVSWPQCPSTFPPTSSQFLVVGLTNGLPFTKNPCVSSQAAWAIHRGKPTQAYAMAAYPTAAQLLTFGSKGPWSSTTLAGRLSNVGYAEAQDAMATVRSVAGWSPRMIWIDVEPRAAQPWPGGTALKRMQNRYVVEGLMRGLRDGGHSYGLYSYTSGWQAIVGSWWLPGVPVWAASGKLDHPNEALDKCTQPSFSGGRVYLSQWINDEGTLDHNRTCEPYAFTKIPMPPASLSNSTADFNADWNNDLIARWTSNGSLKLYAGNGTGQVARTTQIGVGWGGMSLLETLGDFSGDGAQDVVARDRSTGVLWLYRGDAAGSWRLPRLKVGTGWNGMNAIVGVGDLDGDGRGDVVARAASTGDLHLYPGTGASGFRASSRIATGWAGYNTIIGAGDFNGDAHADLLARESTTGILWLVPGRGNGTLSSRIQVGNGWNSMTAIMSPGDFNGDRTSDLLASDVSGRMWLYPRTADGGWSPRILLGSGWNVVDADF